MKLTLNSGFVTEHASHRHPHYSWRAARGFSLTELAIVMGVVGVIAAGIWTVAAQGMENGRQQTMSTDIVTVVRNVRAYYAGQAGITAVGGGTLATITANLTALSPAAIPQDMFRTGGACIVVAPSSCVDTPWGALDVATSKKGSFGVCAWDPSKGAGNGACEAAGTNTPLQFFAVELDAMPLAACLKAVQVNSGSTGPPGLYDVVINGASMRAAGVGFPIPATTARANCAGDDKIDFVFRLATPQS